MKQYLNSLITFIRSKPKDALLLLTFGIAIAILLRLYWQTKIDDNWDQFIIEHNCMIIKKEGSNNHRTSWTCDDGETYYRWRQQANVDYPTARRAALRHV